MARFHIHPETGDPLLCKAEIKCPFGGEHFDSKEEARLSVEKTNDSFSQTMKRAQSERLLPELEVYVTDGPLGRFLNHPLVQDIMVDAAPGFANARLKQKKEQLQRAIENKDWSSFIFIHERPYRFDALEEAVYTHEVDSPGELIRQVWIDSENIHQNYEAWGDLIRDYGVTMSDDDKKAFDKLPEEFTIYRGCTPAGDTGYSWTVDENQAVWFAERFEHEEARVISSRIKKSNVRAFLAGRGESEVLVLPEDFK